LTTAGFINEKDNGGEQVLTSEWRGAYPRRLMDAGVTPAASTKKEKTND